MQPCGEHKLILAYSSVIPHSDRYSQRAGKDLLAALIEVFEKFLRGNCSSSQLQTLSSPLKGGNFDFDLVPKYSCHSKCLNSGVNHFPWPSCNNCQGSIRMTPAQLAPALTERGVPVKFN